MERRGLIVLVALLALGGGSGYALSAQTGEDDASSGVGAPLPARSPSVPVEPTQEPVPDPDDPALRPGIALTTQTLGSGRFAVDVPVPVGWRTNDRATNAAKWKQPGTSNNTYVMRVEQITSRDLGTAAAIDLRVARVRAEQDDVEPISRGVDSLEYTYRSDEGTARHTFMRWVDLDEDGTADLEIVVHGRERDVPGTSDLIERVASGVRPADGGSG